MNIRRLVVTALFGLAVVVAMGVKAHATSEARRHLDTVIADYSWLVDATYGGVSVSLPLLRVTIRDLSLTPLSGEEPMRIQSTTIYALDRVNRLPHRLRVRLRNVHTPIQVIRTIPGIPADLVMGAPDYLTGTYEFDWSYNQARSDLELVAWAEFPQSGSLDVRLAFGNLSVDDTADHDTVGALKLLGRLGNTLVRAVSIRVQDVALLDALVGTGTTGGAAGAVLLASVDAKLATAQTPRRRELLRGYKELLMFGGELSIQARPPSAVPASRLTRFLLEHRTDEMWEALQTSTTHRTRGTPPAREHWFGGAMVLAAASGDGPTVERWLEGGAHIHAVDARGVTALTYAVERNDLQLAKLLIDHGADPTSPNEDGTTALMRAGWLNDINYPARADIIAVLESAIGTAMPTNTMGGSRPSSTGFSIPFAKAPYLRECPSLAETERRYGVEFRWQPDADYDYGWVLLPDSQRVAFTRALRQDQDYEGPLFIVMARIDGSEPPRVLYANCGGKRQVYALSATNEVVVIQDFGTGHVIVVDLPSGGSRHYASSGGVGISSDGRHLARLGGEYRRWNPNTRRPYGDGVDLIVSNLDGSDARQVTQFGKYDYGQDIWWTPDGRRVVFDVGPADTQGQRCRIGPHVSEGHCFDVYEYDISSGALRFLGRTAHYLS